NIDGQRVAECRCFDCGETYGCLSPVSDIDMFCCNCGIAINTEMVYMPSAPIITTPEFSGRMLNVNYFYGFIFVNQRVAVYYRFCSLRCSSLSVSAASPLSLWFIKHPTWITRYYDNGTIRLPVVSCTDLELIEFL